MELVRSLAGTNQLYTAIQGRIRKGVLHVQGQPPNRGGNRNYGVAADLPVHNEFRDWLTEQNHTEESLADTGEKYVPMLVRLDAIHACLRFQIAGDPNWGNRNYGYAFCILYIQADNEDNDILQLVNWLRADDNE